MIRLGRSLGLLLVLLWVVFGASVSTVWGASRGGKPYSPHHRKSHRMIFLDPEVEQKKNDGVWLVMRLVKKRFWGLGRAKVTSVEGWSIVRMVCDGLFLPNRIRACRSEVDRYLGKQGLDNVKGVIFAVGHKGAEWAARYISDQQKEQKTENTGGMQVFSSEASPSSIEEVENTSEAPPYKVFLDCGNREPTDLKGLNCHGGNPLVFYPQNMTKYYQTALFLELSLLPGEKENLVLRLTHRCTLRWDENLHLSRSSTLDSDVQSITIDENMRTLLNRRGGDELLMDEAQLKATDNSGKLHIRRADGNNVVQSVARGQTVTLRFPLVEEFLPVLNPHFTHPAVPQNTLLLRLEWAEKFRRKESSQKRLMQPNSFLKVLTCKGPATVETLMKCLKVKKNNGSAGRHATIYSNDDHDLLDRAKIPKRSDLIYFSSDSVDFFHAFYLHLLHPTYSRYGAYRFISEGPWDLASGSQAVEVHSLPVNPALWDDYSKVETTGFKVTKVWSNNSKKVHFCHSKAKITVNLASWKMTYTMDDGEVLFSERVGEIIIEMAYNKHKIWRTEQPNRVFAENFSKVELVNRQFQPGADTMQSYSAMPGYQTLDLTGCGFEEEPFAGREALQSEEIELHREEAVSLLRQPGSDTGSEGFDDLTVGMGEEQTPILTTVKIETSEGVKMRSRTIFKSK